MNSSSPIRFLRALACIPLAGLYLLVARLVWCWAGTRRIPADPPPVQGLRPRRVAEGVSVLLVSCDGRHLLERSLPALRRALRHHGGPAEVLVVANGSRDGTQEWLAREHGWVRCLALPGNLGFGGGNNAALAEARHATVVLLNDDMIVEEDFLAPLLAGFRDDDVFAVSAQIVQLEGVRREETGNTAGTWRAGELHLFHDPVPAPRPGEEHPVLWAGGGASAFDAAKLRQLGGFDPIYAPAYAEDLDLSWRAWKRGWRCVLAPRSRVLHLHRATSTRLFSPRRLRALVLANRWAFHLACLTDAGLLREHRRAWPLALLRATLHEGLGVALPALLRVLGRLPSIARRRAAWCAARNRIPDRALLAMDPRFVVPAPPRTSRPRVLVIAAYVPRLGAHGGAMRMYHLLEELAGRHDITVLAFAESQAEAAAGAALTFCEEVEVLQRERTPWAANPFRLAPPAVVSEYSDPRMRERIRQRLASGRYDLVHVEYLQMAHLLPEHHTVPRLLTDHEVQCVAYARQVWEARGLARLRRVVTWMRMLRFELGWCRAFQRVVTVTDPDAAGLLQYRGGLRVAVNNTGGDVRHLRPAPEPDEDRLVFVGYFGHQPNVEAMVRMVRRILPRIRARVPGVTLSIVGSSPPAEILALEREPGVRITGRVPEIAPEVHAAKVFVVPLTLGAGIRGKILEAWALGRAVVATRVAVAGLRCRDGLHLRIADRDDEFADAVVEVLRDPELRRRMVANALRRVQAEYAWEVKAAEHDRIWREVLAEAGGRHSGWPWRRDREVDACTA